MDNDLRDDVISAALDGERVDVEALRQALRTSEGREALAAFVLLRAASAGDDIAPGKPWENCAVTATGRPRGLFFTGPRVPAAWAASIAAVAIAASFWFGTTLRAPNPTLTLTSPPSAPAPTLAPVIVAPTASISGDGQPDKSLRRTGDPRAGRAPAQPPTPTRTLRFVPGVDWTSAPE